jgi:hypothetical protein
VQPIPFFPDQEIIMSLSDLNHDPGPSKATQIGLGIGLCSGSVIGMILGFLAADFAGFEMGKRAENWRMNRLIAEAGREAALYKETGYHSLRDMIQDYEEREEVAFAIRRMEADFLKARAAEIERLTK